MVLSDFLSGQNNDDSNPHGIISFNMYQVVHEKYYNTENYLMQARSQARSSGIKLPEVHSMGKEFRSQYKTRRTYMPIP